MRLAEWQSKGRARVDRDGGPFIPPNEPAHLHTPSRDAALELCRDLVREPAILERFSETMGRRGVVGEQRTGRLVYLTGVSALLPKPNSAVLKGPSASGKSRVVKAALEFLPSSAVYELSAMSERSLVYSKEPLKHRVLVVYEAAGLKSDFASYIVRSLLSEGKIRYETVMRTKDGLAPKLIEREGPTSLIVTTTAVRLHQENETRLLSIPVDDSTEHTKSVMRALAADDASSGDVDLGEWHALHDWLKAGSNRVTIPYAGDLAEKVPPIAVRLRRDFGAVLNLIRTHALLHQARRERDSQNRIVAALDDYTAIRNLVLGIVSDSVEATVPVTARETVEAVAKLMTGSDEPVNVVQVARQLGIDRSAAQRRVYVALDRGYLTNLEDRPRRPARLRLGDPLPEEQTILPESQDLGVQVCTSDERDKEKARLKLLRDELGAEVIWQGGPQ